MRLRKATLFIMIGTAYFFVSRIIGTFMPGLFRNITAAQVTAVLSLAASSTILAFYSIFYRDYTSERTALRKAAAAAVIGGAALVLLYLKGVLILFNEYHYISPLGNAFFEPLLPWFASMMFLIFFAVFYREVRRNRDSKLETAALAVVVGSLISLFIRTFTAVVYLRFRSVRWFMDLPRSTVLILLPVVTFGFVATLYFFLVFYRKQGKTRAALIDP